MSDFQTPEHRINRRYRSPSAEPPAGKKRRRVQPQAGPGQKVHVSTSSWGFFLNSRQTCEAVPVACLVAEPSQPSSVDCRPGKFKLKLAESSLVKLEEEGSADSEDDGSDVAKRKTSCREETRREKQSQKTGDDKEIRPSSLAARLCAHALEDLMSLDEKYFVCLADMESGFGRQQVWGGGV